MQDNKCWMLDNLRYKPNGDTTGTATATGFSAVQLANTGTYLSTDGTQPSTIMVDTKNDAAKYIDPIIYTSGSYCRDNTNKSPENITKCGLLYNFYTTNAGTIPYNQATAGSTGAGSICPSGWHLPTGYNASGDFATLDVAAGSTYATSSTPPQTTQLALWWHNGAWRGLLSGYYGNNFYSQGTSGYYWSSSVQGMVYGYYLYFHSASVYPGTTNGNRYYGSAVRCVL